MSVNEIINELPKLTEAERRAVRAKLLALASENEDVNLCNPAELEGALILKKWRIKSAIYPIFQNGVKRYFPTLFLFLKRHSLIN